MATATGRRVIRFRWQLSLPLSQCGLYLDYEQVQQQGVKLAD